MARPAAPTLTSRLLCALDSEGKRHLLVQLRKAEETMRDIRSRGLKVTTEDLLVRDQTVARYLDLKCDDAAGYLAFDLIGGEIAAGLADDRAEPAQIISRVLAKWRRFWGQLPLSLLSREELLGLFAELWFLSTWLVPRIGGTQAVQRWRGPFRARHDFEWPGISVEVKATTSTRGRIHHINGLEQLEPPENGELFLFSLRIGEEAGAGHTLPSVAAACRVQLSSDIEAMGQFEAALAQAGYSPVHDEEYAKVHLRVVEEGLFAVKGGFPRVLKSTFPKGVPSGVERVEYEINLNGCGNLLVASRPDQASVL